MSRPCFASINIAAFRHNLQHVKKCAPRSQIIAMVKANAYGHGIEYAVQGLQATDNYGVASIEEAAQLRKLGVRQPIIIFDGFFTVDELGLISHEDFSIAVHSAWQVEALEQSQITNPVAVWLKINTGMNRLGFLPQDVNEIWQRLQNCQQVKKPINLMTHFAESEAPDQVSMRRQIECFKEMTKHFHAPSSLANSAAIISAPETHADAVRPGIMLYGVSPFANQVGKDVGLIPVMTLHSCLIATRVCQRGDAIGYGGTFHCPENMLVGVAAIGYGDGYPRYTINGTPVLVNQEPAALIGRVSMDMISIDLRQQPNAKIGDPVVLWGNDLPIEKIADCANTIAYELLCGITNRVKYSNFC